MYFTSASRERDEGSLALYLHCLTRSLPRLAGTEQSKQGSQQQVDELALFVQRDASRIDRIRKRYSLNSSSSQAAGSDGEDDEHDDYGFNRRPSVRGIRPRFGTTQEIVNQVRTTKAHLPRV